jgi:hypothetical protein
LREKEFEIEELIKRVSKQQDELENLRRKYEIQFVEAREEIQDKLNTFTFLLQSKEETPLEMKQRLNLSLHIIYICLIYLAQEEDTMKNTELLYISREENLAMKKYGNIFTSKEIIEINEIMTESSVLVDYIFHKVTFVVKHLEKKPEESETINFQHLMSDDYIENDCARKKEELIRKRENETLKNILIQCLLKPKIHIQHHTVWK